MQALILAGGEGTRLRPLTLNTPKPIVPVGNQPFLLRQIELLKKAQITDVTLSLNYQPSAIAEVLGDGSDYGVHLRYVVEPRPLGTGGAYKFADEFLTSPTVVLNGDILTDIDLNRVVGQHNDHNALATIVLTEVEDPSVYGLVEAGEDCKVITFSEKPAHLSDARTINAGIYVFEPRVLDFIPAGEKFSFEYQLFPAFLKQGENFRAFFSAPENYWLDIGTPERYLQAHHDLMAGHYKSDELRRRKNDLEERPPQADEKSIIGENCRIETGAKISNSVLADGVTIGENAEIHNSVIWRGTTIGAEAKMDGAIVGAECRIGRNVTLTKGAMLGDGTVVSDFSIC